MNGSRRLPWVLVGILAVAVAALVVVLVLRGGDGADDAAQGATPSGTPSTTASTMAGTTASAEPAGPEDEPGAEPSTGPTPDDDGPPLAAMPLSDPGDHLPDDEVSAIPAVGEDLRDEDYFVHLAGVDVTARTIGVDVEVFYFGDAAVEYLLEHDPTAEIPPPNGYYIVNESPALRTLPLADDARIWDWCFGADGLTFAERSLDEWAAAPAGGETACEAGAALSHGWNEIYWLQVRGGEVKRVIGQYLP